MIANKENSDEPPLVPAENGRASLFSDIPKITFDNWRWQFRYRIKTLDELVTHINIPEFELNKLRFVEDKLHFAITPYYLSLIQNINNPYDDPVGLQCIPSSKEFDAVNFESVDPLCEEQQMPVEGLVHRYPDRVLLITTATCGMLCRFCTRKRRFDDEVKYKTLKDFDKMFVYIKEHKEIRDVIISGGDPLTLPTKVLDYILTSLRNIDHIEIIRIGTRVPVVMPQKCNDPELLEVLKKYEPLWVNTHFNTVNELTSESKQACTNLRNCGVVLCNQNVLLKGVNDTYEKMGALWRGLLKIGVKPYYMFRADESTPSYLRTSIEKGLEILDALRGRISGLAIPTYIVDTALGKVPLLPDYIIARNTNGYWTLKTPKGEIKVKNC